VEERDSVAAVDNCRDSVDEGADEVVVPSKVDGGARAASEADGSGGRITINRNVFEIQVCRSSPTGRCSRKSSLIACQNSISLPSLARTCTLPSLPAVLHIAAY
jgi:hypothetical protein